MPETLELVRGDYIARAEPVIFIGHSLPQAQVRDRPADAKFERMRIPIVARMLGRAVLHHLVNDLDRPREFPYVEPELYLQQWFWCWSLSTAYEHTEHISATALRMRLGRFNSGQCAWYGMPHLEHGAAILSVW